MTATRPRAITWEPNARGLAVDGRLHPLDHDPDDVDDELDDEDLDDDDDEDDDDDQGEGEDEGFTDEWGKGIELSVRGRLAELDQAREGETIER